MFSTAEEGGVMQGRGVSSGVGKVLWCRKCVLRVYREGGELMRGVGVCYQDDLRLEQKLGG